ncbi:MAG: amino acid deaminase [Lentisphaeria bacterium]|nr:amino acid deaminase [Lentisphaeria bacterium]NQZ68380.1 amino acid deaminase [Lentisphaeria bacterium]
MNLKEILDTEITSLTKGVPGNCEPFKLSDVGAKNWNVLKEDLPLPLLLIKEDVLLTNSKNFSNYIAENNVSLAPHGKTTMCPQIFQIQLDHGSWGMTAATANQMQVYRKFGVERILMANQLVGKQNIRFVVDELNADENFEFYCLLDSHEHFDYLEKMLSSLGLKRPLNVLLELGMEAGRTGIRELSVAQDLAYKVHQSTHLNFAGIEAFEGLVGLSDADLKKVQNLLNKVVSLCDSLDFIGELDEVILSAGGSAFFDQVVEIFGGIDLPNKRIVIRSGCYITHDHKGYENFQEKALSDKRHWCEPLKPALEIWSYVQSIPEKGLALLTMGRRDAPFDVAMPTPLKSYRNGDWQDISGATITALNDQHAFFKFDESIDLQIGDMICSGISHPCTAFDKWSFIPVVNNDYDVTRAFLTFF